MLASTYIWHRLTLQYSKLVPQLCFDIAIHLGDLAVQIADVEQATGVELASGIDEITVEMHQRCGTQVDT